MGIKVEVRNGNVEQAMRVMKRKLLKDGLLRTLKMKQYYEKPSDKRVRKKKEMIANYKKKKAKLERLRGY